MEPLPSVKSLNTNTVESHLWQVTTMYQVPGWGSIGMGELPSVGAQEIGAGEKPGWSAQFFKLKIERPEFFHLRDEV